MNYQHPQSPQQPHPQHQQPHPQYQQPQHYQNPHGSGPYAAKEKHINKHVFAWVFNFLLGGYGVDRFVRGQVLLGILKIIFLLPTLGIWSLVDWIISLNKAYGGAFGGEKMIVFINGRYAR